VTHLARPHQPGNPANNRPTQMPDSPQIIPTPEQMEALSVTFQRFGRACQVAVDQIVDAFAAVMADEAEQAQAERPHHRPEAPRTQGQGAGAG